MKKGIWAMVLGLIALLAVGCGEQVIQEDTSTTATPPAKGGGQEGGTRQVPN